MEKLIGLYGGTFDPPHNAHLQVAKAFLKAFPSSSLVVMPCFAPLRKEQSITATPRQRLQMTRLCFEELPRTTVSEAELQAGGKSYTYLTVERLKEEYPNSRICLLMGQDNLEILEKWRNFRYLLENCKIAAVCRYGKEASEQAAVLKAKYGADVEVLPMPQSAISSTEIRDRLKSGEDCKSALTPSVLEYIESEGLYRDMDIAAILTYIQRLSPRRLTHTMNAEKAAWIIAKNHYPELDKKTVAAAAYLHDCTKEIDPESQHELCSEYGVELDEVEKSNPKLLHAKTGAAVAKALFGLPKDAADAISYHTTGKADMSPLEKTVYLADFIECGRQDEFCTDVRKYYYENLQENKDSAVDKTLLYALTRSVAILEQELKVAHKHTIEARNFLKESLADENDSRGTDQ